MKQCSTCKQWKDESEFSKDCYAKDGLRCRCKQCDSDFRNYVRNNPYIKGKQEKVNKEEENKQNIVKIENKKQCNCCKQWKDINDFYRNKNHVDGRADTCKSCQEARRKRKIQAWQPQWQKRNDYGQKQCSKCLQWKDESEFSKGTSPDGLNTVCKECDRKRAAAKRKSRDLYSYEKYNEQGQKLCSKCNQWKDIKDFCICSANRDGLSNICKQCQHDYDAKRRGEYIPNYLQHKDGKKFCLTCKQWVDEKDFYKSKHSKDGLSSRCKFCQQNYDKEHKEQIAERAKKRRLLKLEENPIVRLNESFSASIRNALKKNKAGYHWEDLVFYSLEQLKMHLENQFTPEMNWNNYGILWEVDHIIPKNLFSFNSYTDRDFQICWSLMNLRPLNRVENRKRPKDGSDISEELKQKILNQNI